MDKPTKIRSNIILYLQFIINQLNFICIVPFIRINAIQSTLKMTDKLIIRQHKCTINTTDRNEIIIR